MMRFEPVSKPAGFEDAEANGTRWLKANAAGRPTDRWSAFKAL